MSDHNEVKMTEMNYDKDRPAAENPVKIEDLARTMIKLSGLEENNPDSAEEKNP